MGSSKRNRRYLTVGLRSLFLFTAAVATGLFLWNGALRQQELVKWVQSQGGTVQYYYIDYDSFAHPTFGADGTPILYGASVVPQWITRLVGPDCFGSVQSVQFDNSKKGKRVHISDLERLAQFSKLRNLEFFSCTTDLVAVGHLRNLKRLRLNDQNLENIDALSTCTELNSLELQSSSVSDITPLAPLKRLQHLVLHRAPVEDLTPLLNHPSLRTIDLSHTDLASTEVLRTIKSLHFVDLSNTRVSKAEVEALKASLPSCKIRW